ncbi:hypothetical protein ACEWPB_00600 (plasmid) [Priestia megaterium]|uniref:hypothetical protein n=1 Tax=Priestia megaterium TaxID=1404 RepID=UPI0035C9F23C
MKRNTITILCAVLSLSLFLQLGVTNFSDVQAAETDNSAVVTKGTESLDNIIDDVSKNVSITDESISLENESAILESITQEDIDNLNELAKEQGIQYEKPLTKEYVLELLKQGINSVNSELNDGNLEVLKDGSLIESDDDSFYVQGGSTYDKTYWWGKKRYKSTANANKWASQLNSVANANAAGAVIAGAVFGGVGAIPNGLTAAYSYQLAQKVSYRNSLNNRGIIANLTWTLVFTTASQ